MVLNHVDFPINFLQQCEVEDATGWGVDSTPWLARGDHLVDAW